MKKRKEKKRQKKFFKKMRMEIEGIRDSMRGRRYNPVCQILTVECAEREYLKKRKDGSESRNCWAKKRVVKGEII